MSSAYSKYRKISSWFLLALAGGIFLFLLARCFTAAHIARYLELTVISAQQENLEVFWGNGPHYSTKRSASREIYPDDGPITFRIPLSNERITHFRLDPVAGSGEITITSMVFGEAYSGEYQTVDLSLWQTVQAVALVEKTTDGGLFIRTEAGAVDPQLQMQYELSPVLLGVKGLVSPFWCLLLFVSLFMAWWLRQKRGDGSVSSEVGFLRYGMLVAGFGVMGLLTVPALCWLANELYREKAFFEIDLLLQDKKAWSSIEDEQTIMQFFYNTGKGFWHGDSGSKVLGRVGVRESMRFNLDADKLYELRLDPVNGPFSMEIYGIRFGSTEGSLGQDIDLSHVYPRQQIEVFERHPDRLVIRSMENADDPQLKINLPHVFSTVPIQRGDHPGALYGFLAGVVFGIFLIQRGRSECCEKRRIWMWGILYGFLLISAFLIRVLAVYAIYPGDAPDERAHMGLLVAISDGQLLPVAKEFPMTGYAFSIYNPLPYLPSVLALDAVWERASGEKPLHSRDVFLNHLHELDQLRAQWEGLEERERTAWYDYVRERGFVGHSQFSFETTYTARMGNLFWAFAYLLLIPLVIKPYRKSEKILLLGLLAFTPQILFVQSYVNLDSMGLFVALYLFWAVREERWRHAALACLLTAFCKMNFYCIYFLPVAYLFFRYPWQWNLWIKRSLWLFGPSFVILVAWNWYAHFEINEGMIGSALSIAALYGVEPGGSRVFQWAFLDSSLDSAFGLFGYLYQPVPILWSYVLWKWILIPLGLLTLLVVAVRSRPWKALFGRRTEDDLRAGALASAVLVTLLVNVFIHYYASYGNNGYSPQGRYFFGSLVMFFMYWPYATRWWRGVLAPLRIYVNIVLGLLFFFFSFYSLKDMNYHETRFGFDAGWTSDEEPMENMWSRIEPYYPF